MNNLRHLTRSLFLILLFTGAAWALPHQGFYAGGYFGVPVVEGITAKDDLGSFNLETDPGRFFAGTLGYDLPVGSALGDGRLEIEYARRSNGFSEAEFSDGLVPADGDLVVESLMLNSFAVFRTDTRLQPYVGLGLGAARVSVDTLTVTGAPLIDDEELVFAWQGGCGIAVEITSFLRLDLGYRYFATLRSDLTEADGRPVTLEYAAHTGMLGLVVKF